MSDTNKELQNSRLPSNEEVIEELTRDLKSSCIKEDESSMENIPSDKDINIENIIDEALSSEHNENSNDDVQNPDFLDDADEEFLKDREVTLSEDEKKALRDEAEKLKNEGNTLFQNGEYIQALLLYTQGLNTCPLAYDKERSILYANRAAAKSQCLTEKDSAISDCTKAIELNPSYIKAYVRRGQLYKETEMLNEALADYQKILTLDPNHTEAQNAVRNLPSLISERDEKLKTEMLGKLKDLGNMVLNVFGLSTNNFELQKDPNSGGYSVKFHQNPQ